MTLLEALLIAVAGLGAGTINAVIGSGTLITFPVLLALGYPPVIANVSNTLGLVPGSASAVYGYRRELRSQRARALRLAPLTAIGAAAGAVLLLVLPDDAFRVIVPVLIAGALVLIVLQPRISRAVATRRRNEGRREADDGPVTRGGVLATGLYGGYFGAAQGILLFALLANAVSEDMQQANALRNLLAGVANGVAALVFTAIADVAFDVALLIAGGAITGGLLGARIGRRLPPAALRGVVVVVGLAAIAQLLI